MRKLKYNNTQVVPVEQVIKGRLKLQTTQNYLFSHFSVKLGTFENITSSSFISRLRLFDDATKKSFYLLVGGAANMDATRKYFENLLKVKTEEINLLKGTKLVNA